MSREVEFQVKVLKHRAFRRKDRDGKFIPKLDQHGVPLEDASGNPIYEWSFMLDVGYDIGVPAVTVFVDEVTAQDLKETSGNGFDPKKEFNPYFAKLSAAVGTKNESFKDKNGKERTEAKLAVFVDDVEFLKAA